MNQEVPTGVHELEEEVEDDALNEVDDDVPHPVKKILVKRRRLSTEMITLVTLFR